MPYSVFAIAGLGLFSLTIYIIWNILEPILWAIILVYASWPLHTRLTSLLGGRMELSALVILGCLLVILLIPLASIGLLLQKEWWQFFEGLSEWLSRQPQAPDWLRTIPVINQQIELILAPFETIQSLARHYAIPWLRQASGEIMSLVEGIGWVIARMSLTLFVMFFCYRDGIHIAEKARTGLILIFGQKILDYCAIVESTIIAVVYGIVLTAVGQSMVATLGYLAVGLKAPLLLGLLTLLLGIIPFGVAVVWLSASVSLLLDGNTWAATGLFLWGALVVSWVDNVIRPWVISQNTRLPFLLVALGILGGLTQCGLIGLFIGPVILNVSLTAWNNWLSSHNAGERR